MALLVDEMMLRGVLVIAVMVLVAQPVLAADQETASPAATPLGPTDPNNLETFIDSVMAESMESHHVPGAAVAVVRDGKLLLAKGYGWADADNRVSVDPETTLFRLASVSKLFTWTAVMQLVEQGKLDLNADVNTYLTDLKIPDAFSQPITLGHLMNHTAGFEDRFLGMCTIKADGMVPLKDLLAEHIPTRAGPPGQITSYSNLGVALAGHIVAEVSGMSYDRYIEQNILQPLGMARTTTRQPLPAHLAADLAAGYQTDHDTRKPVPLAYIKPSPAGGMSSTAADMARFMIAHLQNGRHGDVRILADQTAQQMHTQSFAQHPDLPGWAHGFHEDFINGQRIIAHDGSLSPYFCTMILVPQHDLGFFIATNGSEGYAARSEFRDAFFDHYSPVPERPAPTPPPDSEKRVHQVVGLYRPTRRPHTTIEKVAQLMTPARLRALQEGTIDFMGSTWAEAKPWVFREVQGDDTLIFLKDDRGNITYAVTDMFNIIVFEPVPWYDTPALHWRLLIVAGLIMLSAVVRWPILHLLRRRRGRVVPEPDELASLARRTALIAAALALASSAFKALALFTGLFKLDQGVPLVLRLILIVPVVVAALTLGTVVFAVLAWRQKYWSIWARVHYSLLALALLSYVWFVDYWNLLGWRFG